MNSVIITLTTLAGMVRRSRFVEKSCLFGVDGRVDDKGREIERDRTVCATNEEVLEVARRHPGLFIPFFSVNPRRRDALERIVSTYDQWKDSLRPNSIKTVAVVSDDDSDMGANTFKSQLEALNADLVGFKFDAIVSFDGPVLSCFSGSSCCG